VLEASFASFLPGLEDPQQMRPAELTSSVRWRSDTTRTDPSPGSRRICRASSWRHPCCGARGS
jgi:hypothetical protein